MDLQKIKKPETRGRKKKYLTDEERREAIRQSQRRYYYRSKESEVYKRKVQRKKVQRSNERALFRSYKKNQVLIHVTPSVKHPTEGEDGWYDSEGVEYVIKRKRAPDFHPMGKNEFQGSIQKLG